MALSIFKRGKIWWVRGTVGPPDRCRRVYKSAATTERPQAEAYRDALAAELWQSAVLGERAVVSFGKAARSYIEQRRPRPNDASCIERLIKHFGERRLVDVATQGALDEAVVTIAPGLKPSTQQRSVITPFCAILNHAARRGWCDAPRFERPAQPKGKTAWLTPDQALELIDATKTYEHRSLFLFYLGTGARVSEALDLQWRDVDLHAGTCMLRETKNGRDRLVKLPPTVVVGLTNLPHRDGHVFRRPGTRVLAVGAPYKDKGRNEGGQIKTAFRRSCMRAGLFETLDKGKPNERQVPLFTPHSLRHTWATWFYAATHDPLRLKAEGGWTSLAMVERYAHLMPSHLTPTIAKVWGCATPDLFPSAQRGQNIDARTATG